MPSAAGDALQPTASPSCPRCGYDLRGTVATWRDSCPLTGVCAECGLAFEWRDLLTPSRQVPAWSIEAARGPAWLRAFFATQLYSFAPFRFWGRMPLFAPPRLTRLAVYSALVLAQVYLVFAMMQGVLCARALILSQQQAGGAMYDTNVIEAFARGVLLPLSNESLAQAQWQGGMYWINPPRELVVHLWVDEPHVTEIALYLGGFAAGLPLAFLALPISLRRAKVRFAHVVRIAASSTGLLVPGLVLMMLVHYAGHTNFTGLWWVEPLEDEGVRTVLNSLLVAGTLGLLTAFWCAAVWVYLRMDQGVAIIAAIVSIAFMAGFVALFACFPDTVSGIIYEFFWRGRYPFS